MSFCKLLRIILEGLFSQFEGTENSNGLWLVDDSLEPPIHILIGLAEGGVQDVLIQVQKGRGYADVS